MVDYKEQVFIIGIKANMQYLICHILPKKKIVSNVVVRAADLPVNLELALMTMQQFGNLVEQNSR